MKKSIILLFTIPLACISILGQNSATEGKAFMPAHLFQDLDQHKNLVYSPSFRASWTVLTDDVLGEPVKLLTSVPIAEELNLYPYDPGIYSDDWIIAAGFVEKGIIEKINSEAIERYRTEARWIDDIKNEKEGILCYSYLKFEALFNEPFEEFKWTYKFSGILKDIECFGVSKGESIKKAQIRKQVSIHDYRNPDDFIIRIIPSDPEYEILITEMQPEENLSETLDQIDRRIEECVPDYLGASDELIIPKVKLEVSCIYLDLINKYLINTGFERYFIAAATTGVSFSLNQTGAKAEVSGKVLLKKGPVPRIYAIDNPFIITIRKMGSSEPLIFVRVVDNSYLTLCEKN